MDKIDFVIVEEAAKEFTSREAKSTLEKAH
jgi:hypothetical protein